MAIGIALVAGSDLVLEIGHSFVHAPEYLSGKMKVHTHKIGNSIVVHHNHTVLQKIEKAVEKVAENDSEDNCQNNRILKFDQLKLISQDSNHLFQNSSKTTSYYQYNLKLDQISIKLPSPPPQIEIV